MQIVQCKLYTMSRSELNISRWLEAHSDCSAGLITLPRNLILSDVFGDNDHRLVLTDLRFDLNTRCRLKIYKGTLLISDQPLADIPSGLISFYTDNIEPRIPTIGVACGPELLLYKNNKPYYKFMVPPSALLPEEEEIWKKLDDSDFKSVINDLKKLPYGELSGRSQELLNLETNQDEYLSKFSHNLPVKMSPIIALTTLNKSTHNSISCPVLGTECGHIYVLNPQSFTILHQANVSSVRTTPTIIKASGNFDVEYRIIIACRENTVCLLRRQWLEGKVLIQLSEDIVDLILTPGDFIVVATANKMLHNFTKRGQRVWSVALINYATCLCLVPLKHRSAHLVGVGLRGGAIHLYHGRQPVDYTNVPDTPSAIIFGQMGQEEHVMIVVTLAGTINFKILKRTADFNLSNQDKLSSPTIQTKPLPLPKRSKLFLEQSIRERQNAVEIHQNFQQDLMKLRLTAARTLVQNLSDQSGIGNEREQIKLSAQVIGLGPKFTLILNLENMHSEKPIMNFLVNFHAKPSMYTLTDYVIKVPLIPPGLSYKIEAKIIENHEEIPTDNEIDPNNRLIRIFVIRRNQNRPVIAATINMPPTEIAMLI